MDKLPEIRAFILNFDWVDDGPRAKAMLQAVLDLCHDEQGGPDPDDELMIGASLIVDAMHGAMEGGDE